MVDSYALIPNARNTPVDPTWDSGPPGASSTAFNKRSNAFVPEPESKPPLPVSLGHPPRSIPFWTLIWRITLAKDAASCESEE